MDNWRGFFAFGMQGSLVQIQSSRPAKSISRSCSPTTFFFSDIFHTTSIPSAGGASSGASSTNYLTSTDASFVPAKKEARQSGLPSGEMDRDAWYWSMASVLLGGLNCDMVECPTITPVARNVVRLDDRRPRGRFTCPEKPVIFDQKKLGCLPGSHGCRIFVDAYSALSRTSRGLYCVK